MKMNKLRFQSKILCLCVSLLFSGSVWAQQALLQGTSGSTQLSGAVFTTSEEGAIASSSFRLNIAPTSTLTVSIQGLDTTEHRVTPPSFTFTTDQGVSGGFNNAQTFTINPVDDMFADGTVSYDVTFLVEGGGVGWDGLETTITLVNQDDEAGVLWTFGIAPNIEVLSSYTTTEVITTQQLIRVALTEQPAPPDSSVTFSVTVGGDSDEITIHPQTRTRTFTSTDYDTRQAVAFFAVDDTEVDGNRPYTFDLEVTASTATNYLVGTVFSLPGINMDNETPPADTTAPTLSSSMTENTTVTLAYSEELDPISVPSLAAYTLTVTPTPTTGNELTLSDVSILGQNVILTLSRAPTDTENLNLTYVVPSTNPVQDLAPTPNPAAAFAGLAVKTAGLSVSIADVTVDENVGNAEVTVTVAGTSTAAITATVTITDGTATVTEDYNTPLSNSLTIGTGLATAIIAIPITDDMIDEDSEDFTVTLSNLAGGGGLALTLDNATATVTITDDDTAGFTVVDGGDGTTTSENETSDSFTVVLDSQPTANVELLIGIDATEHTLTTPPLGILTFTPSDWATAQQVTLRGEDDDVFDGDQTYNLMLMLRGGGTGTGYGSVTLPTVEVTNTDNDTAPDSITLSIDPSSVAETADATTITVTATIDGTVVLPTATDVAVTVGGGTATVTTDYTATPSTLTITIPAETLSATGTFMIDPNTSSDNGDTVMVTGTAPSFTTVNPATLTIFEAGVSVHEDMTTSTEISTATIAEAGSDILYVQLASQPAANVVIGVTSDDTNEGMVTPAALTFSTTNWATRQAVTVNAVNDNVDRNGDSFTVGFAVTTGDSGNYTNSLTLPSVTVTVTDNDTAGLTVVDGGGVSTSEGATPDFFTVVLNTQPTDTVTVTISGLDSTEHRLVASTTLTFTTGNWNMAQTVALTGVDDTVVDGDQTYSLTLTPTGGGYTGVTAPTVSVTNTDGDTATVTIADMTVDENAGTATVTVTLTPALTATGNVTVDAMTADGTATAGTDYTAITSQTLTFTAGSTSETLSITISDDSIAEGNETFTVMLSNLMTPATVNTVSITDATATVTITDNDTVGFTVVDGGGVTTSEGSATPGTFTVVLDTQPTDTVTVTITGLDATEHSLAPSDTLMFTTTNWSTAQTVMLTGENDDDVDGDQTYSLTLTPTGGGYTGVAAQTVSVTNTDTDTAELTIADMSVDENAGTATVTVTVTLTPALTATGNVTVDVATTDDTATAGTDYTAITSQTLTFAAGTTSQTLDITISDDNIAEGDETFTVTLSNLMTPATVNTVTITDATATVTITDNETAPTAITLSISQPTIPETADLTSITVTTTLDGTAALPTQTDITVSVGESGDSAVEGTDYATVADFTLTIPAGMTSAMGTFMIDPNTSSTNGDMVTIDGTSGSFTVNSATLTIIEAGISVHDAMTLGNPISTAMIAETSGSDILYVQLASQPATSSSVTISVASSATGEGTVTPLTLTFTDTDWDTRQAVTVNAVSDQIDRDDSFTVDFGITSGDGGNYPDSLMLPSVAVTVTDDDTAGLTVVDGGGVTTSEGSATPGTFTVVLDTQPTDTVTVEITGLDATEHSLAPSTTLTFTTTNWSAAQTVMLTGENDDDVDGDQTYSLTLTPTGGGYTGVAAQTVSVTNTDTDTAELTIADMSVNEGAGTATVTVTLTPAVTAGDVTVNATTADGTAGGTDYTAITSQTLTFTAGSTTQTLSITINDDSIAEGDETFTVMLNTLVQPTGVTTVSIAAADTATVTITDNDTVGFTVVDGGGVTTSETGATSGTFTVVLNTQPTADVTVTITGLVTTEHSLTPSTTLMFTTTNWATAQTVTLNSVDDNIVDGDQTYTLTLTPSGGDYTGVAAQTVSVTNTDTDTAELTIADMSVNEGAGTATVTVTLTPAVTAGIVTVDAMTADGTATAGTDYTAITSQTLTFTAGSTSETLSITISDDSIAEGNETFTVMLGSLSVPVAVSGDVTIATADTATVTITDDETTPTTIDLSVNPSTIVETASATEITVTATIDGTVVLPTPTDVAVTVGGGTATVTTDYTATPSTLTITIPALSSSATGTFMITPVDDSTSDNNETVEITGASGSFTINPATLTIIEAGILVFDAMMDGSQISAATIDETSGSDILYVQLTSQPAGDVTLSVESSAAGEGTVTPPTLTFTDTDWDTRQAVTVNAVSDQIDRDDTFTVDFEIATAADGDGVNYTDSITLPSVTVTVTDDDTAGLTVDIGDGVTTSEGSATDDTFTVVLDTQPTDTATVTISGLDGTEHTSVIPTTLTFTTTNWSAAQTVTLSSADDDDVDGDQTYNLTLSASGGGYDGVTQTVSVTNEDDDTAELTIADTSVNENAGTATVTVTLTPAVTAGTVEVDLTTADGTATSADYTAITSQTLTFTAGSTTQTLSITINDDNIAEGDETFTVMLNNLMPPTGVTTVSIATDDTAEVTITDDDVPGLTVVDGGGVTTSEGSTTSGTFTVVLNTQPTDTVTVTISGLVAAEHSLTPSTTLTFTTANWNMAQTVTLNSVDDNIVDGDQTYTLTLTPSGGDYTGVAAQTVSVTNTDTDTAELTIADMSVNEGAGTATVTVTLTPAVTTGDVTVDATTADGTAIAGTDYTAIASQTLTFTAGSTTQTLDISISDDNIAEGNETFTVMLNNLVPLTGVTIATDDTATVTITDDETAPTAITLSVNPSTVAETASATTITVTATIDGTAVLPTPTDVMVTISGGTATINTDYTLSIPTTTLTITIPALAASATQTFMITPVDDTTTEGEETVTISGTSGSFTFTSATLTIVEAGILVFDAMMDGSQISTVTIAEADSDILYVQLASQPAANVVIGVASSTGEGTVMPATLTFTTGDWDTRQAVTVNAVSDQIDRDDTFTVNFAVTTGDSGNYTNSLTLPSVAVTVTDDDTVGLTVDIGDGVTTNETGTTDTFTVVLDSEPTDTVTMEITGLDATEHTFPPLFGTTLTFTTTNWSTAQTVTLTGVDDDDVDGDQTYSLTLTPTGGGYTGVTAPTVSITNTDDDTAELTIADMVVDENAGTATVTVTVTLTPAVTAGTVTVDATTADGTATSADYTAITSQTLTFTAGSTTQTLDITINDDSIAEGNETFTVMLNNLMPPTGVTTVSIATDDTAEVTITDDETTPTAITLSISPSTVAETADATTITVTATIDGTVVLPTETVVTVSVGGGTATSGTDYTAVSNFDLTIPALSSSGMATFMIDPTDDTTDDNNETVEITGASGSFTVNLATLTIVEAGILVFDAMMDGSQVSTVTIAEASGTDMLYVQLANQPASNVTLSVASSAIGEGTVIPATLTFSTTNWNTRQAVTATAVNDDIDRDDSFTVDFAVTTGDGANYTTSLALSNVTVLVTDDDTAGLALFDAATGSDAPMSITTTEGATTDSFYVVLESEPTGTVTVTIDGLDATEHTSAPPSTLMFTTGNWNTRQEITLTGVDDNDVDGDQTYDITLTPTGGGYESVTAQTVSITNTDDDTAELTIADVSVDENASTATLTVTLSAMVTTGDVTVDATTMDGTATAGTDYTAITSETLTIPAGTISQTLDITINDDNIAEGNEAFTVMLNNLVQPTGVTTVTITDDTAEVTITDDDTLSDTINLSISPSTVAETAGATTITVTATIDGTVVSPTATDVAVSVGGGTAMDEATVTADYTATPSTLTITIPAETVSATQTFMITPVDDDMDDNNETVTISGTATINGTAATVDDTTLTIVEAGILVFDAMMDGSQISTATIDEASSDILYVQLASEPATSSSVTISVTSSATGEGTVSPGTLTFTDTNWNARQALTATAVNDNIDRDGDSFMVDFAITGGDSVNYTSSLTLPSVAVTVTDDDTASNTINLSVSPDRVTETAGDTSITVTATLGSAVVLPTATDVAVTISDGTATSTGVTADYTAMPSTLTITIPAETTSGNEVFSITPVADDVSDNGETVEINGTATINGTTAMVNLATLTIVEFSREDQQAIEQTVAATASGVTQVVTEQIGIRLASRTLTGTQDRQSLSAIDWQDRLAKFTYEGLQRLDSEVDMSLDWLLQAAGGNGQLLMPLGAESLTLWATGGHLKTKGDGVADYDGDVNSFILGIDTALANDWLAGVAISYNDSEIDYTMNGSGETEQTLYGIHPYLSRTVSQGLTLWGTVGYGFGDVDFSHTNHGQATSDIEQWMAAGGLEKQIITNTPWQGALRVKGLWGNAEVDSATYNRGATIAKVDTDFWRAHMESEWGYNFSLPGANIRPYALIGARWDHNDAIVSGDEWHVDVGGGVELSDNDFALNISVRTQVTDGDTEEDSIFATGSLTYDLGQDGQGLQIALSRPLNNTSPAFDSYSFNEVTESGLSGAPLTSELAYGWTVRPFGLKGALQTYVQNSFESSDRHYAVGLELAVNALTLNFETGYHDHTSLNSGETDNTGLESMFKTKIRW